MLSPNVMSPWVNSPHPNPSDAGRPAADERDHIVSMAIDCVAESLPRTEGVGQEEGSSQSRSAPLNGWDAAGRIAQVAARPAYRSGAPERLDQGQDRGLEADRKKASRTLLPLCVTKSRSRRNVCTHTPGRDDRLASASPATSCRSFPRWSCSHSSLHGWGSTVIWGFNGFVDGADTAVVLAFAAILPATRPSPTRGRRCGARLRRSHAPRQGLSSRNLPHDLHGLGRIAARGCFWAP